MGWGCRDRDVWVLLGWLHQLPDPSVRRSSEICLHFIPIPAGSHLCRIPKEKHGDATFTFLLPRSLPCSFAYLQPVPYKCYIWVPPCRGAPLCTEPPVVGVSLSPTSCQPCPPFPGPWDAGSCLHRGGLFRQLDLGQGVLQASQCQLYPGETWIFWERPGQRDVQDAERLFAVHVSSQCDLWSSLAVICGIFSPAPRSLVCFTLICTFPCLAVGREGSFSAAGLEAAPGQGVGPGDGDTHSAGCPWLHPSTPSITLGTRDVDTLLWSKVLLHHPTERVMPLPL